MWGPEEGERTESMASGRGRTLSEQGQMCRLLKPCSRVLIIEVQHDGKALASHKDTEPHERKAPPTPDVKHPKRQGATMEGPGAPGAQSSTAPRAGENVSAAGVITRQPPIRVMQIDSHQYMPPWRSFYAGLVRSVVQLSPDEGRQAIRNVPTPHTCNVSENGLLLVADSQQSHYECCHP